MIHDVNTPEDVLSAALRGAEKPSAVEAPMVHQNKHGTPHDGKFYASSSDESQRHGIVCIGNDTQTGCDRYAT